MKFMALLLALMVSQPGLAQANAESNQNSTDACPSCRDHGALDPSILKKMGKVTELENKKSENLGNGGNATKNSPKNP